MGKKRSTAGRQQQYKPRQILLSKRANVFYLEHVRIVQRNERVIYLAEGADGFDRAFNVPERNTVFLLLGKGTSITDSAMRVLAESNVVVGFVGNGGSPLLGTGDPVFLSPASEYRPTEHMQAWARLWFDDLRRLAAAKHLLHERARLTSITWAKHGSISWNAEDEAAARAFTAQVDSASDASTLLGYEAQWARFVYRRLARHFGVEDFTRELGAGRDDTDTARANSFIDHGNYIAYGYAAASLAVLGISFAFPLLHGKTRRGALVFDVADAIKDAIVLPAAFNAAAMGYGNQVFRDALIEECLEHGAMDLLIDMIQQICGKFGN
jgi:CRISPR-associated protein Cas1